MLFADSAKRKPYSGINEVFHSPKIEKVAITVEGQPNELYSHAMLPINYFEQIANHFGSHDSKVIIGNFMNEEYGLLWTLELTTTLAFMVAEDLSDLSGGEQ